MKNFITNYDPFFDSFFSEENKHSVSHMMKTDIRELEKSYELEIELPNVKKDDTKVSLKDGYLTISATYNNEHENDKYLHRERRYGEYSRSYYVGNEVKINHISATLKDGVLTVSIKKADEKEKEQEHLVTIE